MAILNNAKRRLPQAVYAQVKIKETPAPLRPKRSWVKWGMVAALEPTQREVIALKQQLGIEIDQPDSPARKAAQAALAAVTGLEPVLFMRGEVDVSRAVPVVAKIEASTLADVGARLIKLRQDTIAKAVQAQKMLLVAYQQAQAGQPTETPLLVPTPYFKDVHGIVTDQGNAKVYRGEHTENVSAMLSAQGATPEGVATLPSRTETILVQSETTPFTARRAPTSLTVQDLYEWALDANVDPPSATAVIETARQFSYQPQMLSVGDYSIAMEQHVDHATNVLTAFRKQMAIEPIGILHLERLTFAPDGIERGELVYSVPLAPGEEVNIAHKEWSSTSEEFQRLVTDAIEEYSEEGVTEKSELSQSTNTQHQHANGFNTGVTASGGYGPVSVTASASLSISDSASSTQQFSRNQGIAITRKASTRSKKEHKISFKVASAAGTEDHTIRKIKNPYPDKATRVDYYQLMRKWEVNVYRYGMRLTYDLTIPEPGSDVLNKIIEIEQLKAVLEQGFAAESASKPWAKFDLKPEHITRANYTKLAAQYVATVPAPPVEYKWYSKAAAHQWKTIDEAQHEQFFELDVTVDDEYAIDSVVVNKNHGVYFDKESESLLRIQATDDFLGKSGRRILIYEAKYLSALYVELRVRVKLRDFAFKEWQLKAWHTMRDAAQSRYYEQRLLLKDRLAKLTEELGDQDALSLRKFEREEVMKGVLRWLFGPSFNFIPPGLPTDLYNNHEVVASKATWGQVLAHGELIKFLHHAIEWENVLYFLYPYFWSHLSRWELKKYLNHPDAMHKAFLKAGSARVVLTIRPGFERDFMSLLETGTFDGLPTGHPYLTIIEEMENFAKTNYPGIPPANPEGANQAEEGLLIGTWHEYTPTSALDIAFGETLPTA